MAGRHAFVLCAALVAAGCASNPSRFYTLDSTATAADGPSTRYAIVVGPVSVPASVDRPEIVVQVAPNRVDVDEFNRWAAPLGDSIARAIAGNLATLLGTPDVATGPLGNFGPTYRVTLDVQRFESVKDQTALVEVVWVVAKPSGGTARSGRTIARETVNGKGYEALAGAHSRALAQVSTDIANAIRAEARAKR